jgi:hypothetical protein
MIINEMNTEKDEFNLFMNSLIDANLIKSNNNLITEIYKFVVIKDEIGKVIWYILAGMLIASVSYNSLIEQL